MSICSMEKTMMGMSDGRDELNAFHRTEKEIKKGYENSERVKITGREIKVTEKEQKSIGE